MVVDSSALIAFLRAEPGGKAVKTLLEKGGLMMSTINRTEVKGKLVGMGLFTPQQVDSHFDILRDLLEIVVFDLAQSDLAAFWYARRNAYDLSLGDCACLALGEARGADVLTAEKAWSGLPNLQVKVKLIR